MTYKVVITLSLPPSAPLESFPPCKCWLGYYQPFLRGVRERGKGKTRNRSIPWVQSWNTKSQPPQNQCYRERRVLFKYYLVLHIQGYKTVKKALAGWAGSLATIYNIVSKKNQLRVPNELLELSCTTSYPRSVGVSSSLLKIYGMLFCWSQWLEELSGM